MKKTKGTGAMLFSMIAVIVIICLFIVAGNGAKKEAASKEIRVGLLLYRGDDTFISTLRSYIEEKAKEYERKEGIKVTLDILDAKSNQNTQNNQVDRMLELGCDALCVNIVDRFAASVVIDKAMAADVPVIFFNREPVEEDMNRWEKLYYVGADAKDSAVFEGRILVDAYKKDSSSLDRNGDGIVSYVLLEGESNHQDSLIRTEWSIQTLKDGGVPLEKITGGIASWEPFFRLLAVRDEWFSDDLRKLDDDNVYRKLQGHWIIEMSEMMATANAKSIEEIKSFLSRQKEVYKIPYETHPADRPRQCVFGGTSNALDFLPLDRSGNRRFIPVMVYPEQAEVHILEDEAASRAYISQMWAEAMEIYRSGMFKLSFSPAMQRYLKEHQRDFMPEDTKAGMIQAYLDKYTGETVCSKQLYKEALNHTFDEPKQWEIREINEIMNQCITGWNYFSNPRMFAEYGRQKGWEREIPATDTDNPPEKSMDGFVEVTEQMELPF